MADASWPAMLCEMGSCGWNDPSTLVEILTGPDFLPNGSLTWADKDHALLMLGSFPSHTLAQHIPAFLADLGVHQHAFVFLNEWLEPALLELAPHLPQAPRSRARRRLGGVLPVALAEGDRGLGGGVARGRTRS